MPKMESKLVKNYFCIPPPNKKNKGVRKNVFGKKGKNKIDSKMPNMVRKLVEKSGTELDTSRPQFVFLDCH